MQELYKLGNHSYFSESAYAIGESDYERRYWGTNKERLRDIKKSVDPKRLFSCHNCIGVDIANVDDEPTGLPTHYLIVIFGSIGALAVLIGGICLYKVWRHRKLERDLASTHWKSTVAENQAELLGTNKPNTVL